MHSEDAETLASTASRLNLVIRAAERELEHARASIDAILDGPLKSRARSGSLTQFAAGEPRFSPRQAVIIDLIAAGYSDKQVARLLGIGHCTIRTHLSRLYQANSLHSRAEAVRLWIDAREIREAGAIASTRPRRSRAGIQRPA